MMLLLQVFSRILRKPPNSANAFPVREETESNSRSGHSTRRCSKKGSLFFSRALVSQFMGLWSSPRQIDLWIERNWHPLIQGRMNHFFCGKGFYIFYFEYKEDRDLIFRNGPYFFGPRGLYLNKWTPDFDPDNDIPSVVPVWVRLPHLPFHCWGDEVLKSIGDTLGKFIDRAEPKSNMYSCARIYVEVDLEKGLPEAIKLRLDDWTYIQKLDYEQLSFKCKSCHEYDHFSRNCLNNKQSQETDTPQQEEGWQQVRKKDNTGKGAGSIPGPSRSTPKAGTSRQNPPVTEKPPPKKPAPTPSPIIPPSPSQNSFEILGEPSSRKALPVGPVLEPLAHSTSSALERITEDSGEEESFHEVNQEEDPQELRENPSP
jgi:hypothetical protein